MTLRRSLVVPVALILATLAGGALRARYLWNRKVGVDELEHVHAAWLVSQGQTPFVDFFEHHPPLFYFALAPAVGRLTPGYDALLWLRLLGLTSFLGAGVAICLLVRQVSGWDEALAAGLFVLTNTVLFDVGWSLYLDTFAAPLIILSALWLVRGSLGLRSIILATTAMGLAGLLTQKAAMALGGFGYSLAAAIRRERAEGRNPWPAVLGGLLVGGVLCGALLFQLLGVPGVVGFWKSAVLLNLGWKARHFPYDEFSELLRYDTFAMSMAFWGLVLAARDGWRNRLRPENAGVPAAYLASLLLGIGILPVVWEEYFVLLLPFLCAVAGVALVRSVRAEKILSFEGLGILLGLGAVGVRMSWRVLAVGEKLAPLTVTLVAIAWLVLVGHMVMRVRRGLAPRWAILVLPAFIYSIVVQVGMVDSHRNDGQRARIEYVMRETRPDEPYFDGYSGYGVFRPHLYRYWFLHEEVQPMLTQGELTEGILEALETRKPRLVTVDHWILTLPSEVTGYLEAHYEPTEFPDIWRREEPRETQRRSPSNP
jgi:hypothetical protein